MDSLAQRATDALFTARGRLLIYVIEHPGATVKELMAGLFLSDRSIYDIVSALKRAGYLMARPRPTRDQRTLLYTVTPAGLAALRKLTEGVE